MGPPGRERYPGVQYCFVSGCPLLRHRKLAEPTGSAGFVISGVVVGWVLLVLQWADSRGGVEDQVSLELACDGVDDADVEVLDEQDDAGSLMGSADSDVVQSAVVTDGDGAGFVDSVVADPVGVSGRGRARGRLGHAEPIRQLRT